MPTDIHTHTIPGIDDGPRSFAEADKLLRSFRSAGVDTVICTPHYLHPLFDVSQTDINEAYAALLAARPNDDTWPQLRKGAEVRLSKALVQDIRQVTVPTLGDSPYVLVEFPSRDIHEEELELIHELIVRDYRPIMAHPERNLAVQKNRELILQLRDAGLQMQLTASCCVQAEMETTATTTHSTLSPSKGFHKSRQLHSRTTSDAYGVSSQAVEVTRWMLAHDYVDFIASDAHNVTTRPPCDAQHLRGLGVVEQDQNTRGR